MASSTSMATMATGVRCGRATGQRAARRLSAAILSRILLSSTTSSSSVPTTATATRSYGQATVRRAAQRCSKTSTPPDGATPAVSRSSTTSSFSVL
eukprot:scaffold78883_cov62-Phaeocystis_antarctica.AAC.5